MSIPVAVVSSWQGLAGKAISTALAQCDYSLLINGPEEEIFELQSGNFLGKILAVPFEVEQEESVQNALLTALEIFGRVDVLVNNNYEWNDAPLDEITAQMWDKVLSVNLKGTFHCCRAAAAIMRSQGYGKIINVTSTSAFTGAHTQFAASCAAVHSLTRSLARELAPEIKVNTVACGILDEPWINEGGPELREMLLRGVPLGRLCTYDDVAEAVAFFATGGDFITGQMLVVDGGETMR